MSQYLIPQHNPNWIEIDLDALANNIQNIRSMTNKGVKILLPVKAHGYGHGMVACSLLAQKEGIDFLGTAHAFEAIQLRNSGVHIPILVLGPLLENDFETVLKYKLTPTLTDLAIAKKFNSFLKANGVSKKGQKVHVKIDTGMNRYGVNFKNQTISKFFEFNQIEVEGLYTHMANGENQIHPSNKQQFERFNFVLQQLPHKPSIIHVANSSTLINFPNSHHNMVRPGLMAYGYSPFENRFLPQSFKSVMKLKSTIRQIQEVQKGDGVSYGHKWIAPKKSKIASIAMGYGDGFNRELREGAEVYIKGQACKIVGSVCMDTLLADVSHLIKLNVGEEVDIFNRELSPSLSIEWATYQVGTIPYEQTCRMARRLYRLYNYNGELHRWDSLKEQLGFSSEN